MMIGFATLTIDPFGAQLLSVDAKSTNLGDTSRRVSRVATLDGGASVLDGGYTVTDRTIVIDLTGQSRATIDALKYLCTVHPILNLLTEDGAFRTSPERVSVSGDSARMTLLVVGFAEVKD